MAASVPSPADEFNAASPGMAANERAVVRPRFPGGRRARRRISLNGLLDLCYLIALGTMWSLCAAGCSDRGLVLVGPSTSTSTLRDGLVGLWHFDELTGMTATDSSGHGNDGTLTGFADLSSVWAPGKFGNALAVEAGGYVRVPLSISIDGIASGVTVSAWVYFEGSLPMETDYGTAISRQVGTSIDQYYHLSLRGPDPSPNLFVSPIGNSAGPVTSPKPAARNTWIHLAGTYDDGAGTPAGTGTAILYVNGEMIGAPKTVMGRFQNDTTPLILGGNGNGSGVTELFPGRIDEIALYNRPLSALEIAQLAQGPMP